MTIPDAFAGQVRARGLTPEGCVETLLAGQASTVSSGPAFRLADLNLIAVHHKEVPL